MRGVVLAVVVGLAVVASTAAPAATRPRVIGCARAVYGSIDGWRSAPGTVLAGPVGWPSLVGTPQPRSFFGPHNGLAVFVKGLLVVKPGHVVTVRIPAHERSRLALYYGKTFRPRAQWHDATWFRVSDGAAAITFKACPRGRYPGWTQFAGGFLALGPQCAVVEVRARGSARWLRRRIPFGKGMCG
jgi:hypothetical protein